MTFKTNTAKKTILTFLGIIPPQERSFADKTTF